MTLRNVVLDAAGAATDWLTLAEEPLLLGVTVTGSWTGDLTLQFRHADGRIGTFDTLVPGTDGAFNWQTMPGGFDVRIVALTAPGSCVVDLWVVPLR